jgi:hypothetical protein
LNNHFDNCPIILDPINYHNASKTAYRIDEVKEAFGEFYDFLIGGINNFHVNPERKENIIYELLCLQKEY